MIKGANILVTGGAGFLGSWVVEELLQHEPARVHIIDNLVRGSEANIAGFRHAPNVTFHQADIRDTALLNELMAQVDYCFHLAALRINACAADPRDGFEVMVQSMFELVEAARQHGLKKLIYSSSVSVYGQAEVFPTKEDHHPYQNTTLYGAAKLWGETLLRSYHDNYGLDYVALRYFNLYGPRMDIHGKYTEVLVKWLDCIREGRQPAIFGRNVTAMDFVYVTDAAKANIAALLQPVTDEVFNVGTGVQTSLEDLLALLLQLNHSKLEVQYAEANKVNPVNTRQADITKAKNLLHFKTTIDLEEGLKRLSEWYFAQTSEV